MNIYHAEAGISQLILENTSIAYQQEIESLSCDIAQKERIKAGLDKSSDNIEWTKNSEYDKDLHYIQSLLVTTNWNTNDDVFDPAEVWPARNTPQHKPTNIEHNEHEIVGHMTTNWVIDQDGKYIDDSIDKDNLPSLFHVVNGSVIYKAWSDERLRKRAEDLIQQIESGKKFVSMECMFADFDYAVISPGAEYKIINRNDETAFLTKHLRSYGGNGIYEGCKIGRLLRNIVFTGKGFVDKPANPHSIIFDKDKFFNFSKARLENKFFGENTDLSYSIIGNEEYTPEKNNGVCIHSDNNLNYNQGENFMTTELLKEQNTELKAKIDDLTQKLADANDRLSQVDSEKLENRISELEQKLQAAETKEKEYEDNVSNLDTNIGQLKEELNTAKSENEQLQNKINEVYANELRTSHVSILVDGGISKEVAEKKVDLYKGLSEEQFADLAKELIEAAKVRGQLEQTEDSQKNNQQDSETDAEDNDISDEETDDSEVRPNVLDGVEQNDDVNLSVGSDNNNDIRLKLSKALASMLNKGGDNTYDEEEK